MSNREALKDIPVYITYDDVLLLPGYSEVTPPEVSLKTQICPQVTLDLPILSSPMDTVTELKMLQALGSAGGMGVLHRNLTIDLQGELLKKALESSVKAAAAVGIGPDFEQRVKVLAALNPTAICIDAAHGFTKKVLEAISFIKKSYPHLVLIAGNVATYEGAKASFQAGADIIRVGMGSGSICTTRIMSGVGVPQFSAVVEACRAATEFNRHVIADGGIRTSGDIVKALAAGASAVMVGSLIAGTEESVGELFEIDGKSFKGYRGMGSRASMARGSAARYGQTFEHGDFLRLVPEGVEGLIPCTGKLKDWLHQISGGLRSGFAYVGAKNICELQEKASFIRISQAGIVESHPHTIHLKD